ncbi:hypothetical protein F5Y07DRAFT_364594 [Xylaria sp. FL0933]|nr:hypothetical protein F5Y07DRAFT_364594 [Xylaria sp. FL0933]
MGDESAEQVSPGITCSYTSQETNLQVIDPDGDLSLQVGQIKCANISAGDGSQDHEHELPVTFIVCSKALSRASRFWKRLLYGGFAESKPSSASSASDWLVELPEDNPKAMTIVLNIIHCQFESIPGINDPIGIEDLYQLTVLADKYDLTAILRPWASTWMEFIENNFEPFSSTPEVERLSWIAWVMGDFELYRRAVEHLVSYCPVDVDGDLQSSIGDKTVPLFSSTLEPPGLHELLKRSRLSSVAVMLSIYDAAIKGLISTPPASTPSTVCGQGSDKSVCEAAILGTMIKSLASTRYWPLPEASQVRTCFSTTNFTLSRINIQSPVHQKCKGLKEGDLNILKRGRATRVDFPSSVAERMANQADKSGLPIVAQS